MDTDRSQLDKQLFAGVDVGSMTAKCIILNRSEILSSLIIPTDANPEKAADSVFKSALEKKNLRPDRVCRLLGTGYGRVSSNIFHASVTELTCHARGVRFLNGHAEGLIDIGGQDSKAIKLNPNGSILDFAMNDRCAAGTGRFLEAMARALKIDMNQVGKEGMRATNPCAINSTCVVFAESEVISLLAAGSSRPDIAAGLLESIARRVGTMARRIGLKKNVAFVGGGAKNDGLRQTLERFLGEPFLPVLGDPQLTGALGAAIIAGEQFEAMNPHSDNSN